MASNLRFVFAGGGTGGHLFPALAVAETLKHNHPESECIFLGRKDKIEGRIIPQTEFKFYAIISEGLSRTKMFRNIVVIIKFIYGFFQSLIVLAKYRPAAAFGTGAYISVAPILAAKVLGAKTILLESNSYPGIATKLLSNNADIVFISDEKTKTYLKNKNNTVLSGNPLRNSITAVSRDKALNDFELNTGKKTVVFIGGSLGAKALSEFVVNNFKSLVNLNYQIVLQTGNNSYEKYDYLNSDNVRVVPFFDKVEQAYAMSDVLVSRAGASAISEILLLGVPSILVPSPYVTENHQYHNAKSLEEQGAAVIAIESEIEETLLYTIISLLSDDSKRESLSLNAKILAKPDAAEFIAEKVYQLALEERN